jgi:hypothetical protein|tara:strand:+ start:753 stop:1292 length:540 start_codon:yes stop_codon:yes gene_type:complete
MANTTFDGPVRSKNGFQSIGPGSTVDLTLATDLTVAAHAGRVVTMDPAGTPTAITLPTINATADSAIAGPGSDPNNPNTIGTTFEIFFKDDFTGSIATDGTDKFVGSVMIGVNDGAKKAFVPAASNDTINLLGEAGSGNATKGGLAGSRIKFTAIADNQYMVEGLLIGDGTIATPFADS